MSDELRALVDTSLSNRIPVELRGMDSDGRLVLRFSVNGSRWQASFEGRRFLRAVEAERTARSARDLATVRAAIKANLAAAGITK